MINVCRFWTREGTVVILRPDTEEQQEQTLWFGQMWKALWGSLVDHLTVYSKDNIVFTLMHIASSNVRFCGAKRTRSGVSGRQLNCSWLNCSRST